MKKIFLFLLIIIFVSCGKTPIYGPLLSGTNDGKSTVALNSGLEHKFSKDFSFAIQWDQIPSIGSETPFKVKAWNPDIGSVLGPYEYINEELCVFLWMVMPDGSEHGSSPIRLQKIHSDSGNYYQASDVYFIMAGKWQFHLRSVQHLSDCNSLKTDPYLEEYVIDINVK